MKKRGMTLVEMMVAMVIFLVVTTLAVGAFVSVTKMRTLMLNMRESQQKVRVALEMITRLARQADEVDIDTTSKRATLLFNLSGDTPYKSEFYFNSNKLTYAECPFDIGSNACNTGTYVPIDLLGDSVKVDVASSSFTKTMEANPQLNSRILGTVTGVNPNDPYNNYNLDINTTVILENLR